MKHTHVLRLAAAAAASTALVAQAPSWQNNGSLANSRHGFAMEVIGDYNGNGTADVLIGEPGDLGAAFVPDGGSAMVRDGAGFCITIFYGLQSRRMGTGVGTLPDINGDGIDEVILGSPGWAAFGVRNRGRISLYFGGRDGGGAGGCAGSSYAVPDLLIDQGTASVLNGDEFGVEIEALDDIDGDGLADFAVGAPLGNLSQVEGAYTGYVNVYSSSAAFGGPATPLYTLNGFDSWSRFGDSICGIGDVNGDGIEDLAVGAPDESVGQDAFNGRVRFYDGATGTRFLTVTGTNGDRLGFDLENMGDLDGDGLDDIAMGAIGDRPAGATGATGSVTVVTGAFLASAAATAGTGAALAIPLTGIPNVFIAYGDDLYRATGLSTFSDAFGASIANAGDIDGDGVNDMLVGAPGSPTWDPDSQLFGNWPFNPDAIQTGMARLLSGATGFTIKQYFSPDSATADNFAATVAAGGDLDGDGQNDLAIAAPWEDNGPLNNGAVRVYSGNTEFGFVYGVGNPNSTGVPGTLTATGSQSVALNNLSIEIANVPAGVNGILVMSNAQTAGSPLGNGILYLGGQIFRFPVATTNGAGEATYTIDINMPPAVGNLMSLSRWNFQFWHRDAGSTVNLTNAITVGFY